MGKRAAKALSKTEIKALRIKQRLRKRKKMSLFGRAKISNRLTKAIRASNARGKQLNTRSKAGMTAPENLLRLILVENGIEFQREYEIMGKFYDFYLPNENVLIEVDGIYWHSRGVQKPDLRQMRQRIEDKFKDTIARAKKIPLVRVWEDEVCEGLVMSEIKSAVSRAKGATASGRPKGNLI